MSGRGRKARNRGRKSRVKGSPSGHQQEPQPTGNVQSGQGGEQPSAAAVEQANAGQQASPIVEQTQSNSFGDSFEMSPEEEDIMLRALLAYEEACEKGSK